MEESVRTVDGTQDRAGARQPWRAGWWDWRRMGCALLVWKLIYLGGLGLALGRWGQMDESRFRGVMMRWPREGAPVFASHFATWDGAHYLFLSEVGYGPGVRSNAFYPLYPLLVRWASALTGGSHLLAGLALGNLFSLAGWVLFYEVSRRRFGPASAAWATVLLVVFPGALCRHWTGACLWCCCMRCR